MQNKYTDFRQYVQDEYSRYQDIAYDKDKKEIRISRPTCAVWKNSYPETSAMDYAFFAYPDRLRAHIDAHFAYMDELPPNDVSLVVCPLDDDYLAWVDAQGKENTAAVRAEYISQMSAECASSKLVEDGLNVTNTLMAIPVEVLAGHEDFVATDEEFRLSTDTRQALAAYISGVYGSGSAVYVFEKLVDIAALDQNYLDFLTEGAAALSGEPDTQCGEAIGSHVTVPEETLSIELYILCYLRQYRKSAVFSMAELGYASDNCESIDVTSWDKEIVFAEDFFERYGLPSHPSLGESRVLYGVSDDLARNGKNYCLRVRNLFVRAEVLLFSVCRNDLE